MRVGYDEQVFLAQTHGGISRYVVNLVQAFQQDRALGVDPVPGWRWSANAHSTELGLSRPIAVFNRTGRLTLLGQGGYYLANTGPRRAARRAEVLHHTYFHPRFAARGFRGAHVTTVYDMIPELFPESFPTRDPHLAKREYVRTSDLVLCISESARRDLLQLYGDPGVPVLVTHLGVGSGFAPHLPRVQGLPARYLLFVGRRGGYKDFEVLAEAYAGLHDDGTALVVVGGGAFTEAESARLRALGIEQRVHRIDVHDERLAPVYANALAFVFPSRHEGFGLPTVEAMASGTAVVLANSSSHPEVGGDVARYFPPGDVEALRATLAELVGDAALRADLGAQGVVRAGEFTWEATARATAAAYERLLP